jgi:8-oxo-dGTP pyrophosphatase MutT (NUDIX family)
MSDADPPPPTAELIARARSFFAANEPPVPAKPAATVILLRDAAEGLEVFLIRRHGAMSFAAGMHVFPGGVVDPADAVGRETAEALTQAAIRETFEETGVLLATGSVDQRAALEADRLALIGHRTTLDEVVARHGLVPRPDWLRAWSHWITPEFEPRRYDTWFYVALTPFDQDPREVGGESDAALWATPANALAAQRRGEWLLMPPTEITLRGLSGYACATDAFASAASRRITAILPTIDLDAALPRFVFTEMTVHRP